MPLALILVFAAFTLYRVAAGSQANTSNRANAVQAQRVALERMTRELRQASRGSLRFYTSQIVEFDT